MKMIKMTSPYQQKGSLRRRLQPQSLACFLTLFEKRKRKKRRKTVFFLLEFCFFLS